MFKILFAIVSGIKSILSLFWRLIYNLVSVPRSTEKTFQNIIEKKYFSLCFPNIESGDFNEVLKRATDEKKILIIYIHYDSHNCCNLFCTHVLSNDLIIQLVNENAIFWPVLSTNDKIHMIFSQLKVSTFPLLLFLLPYSLYSTAIPNSANNGTYKIVATFDLYQSTIRYPALKYDLITVPEALNKSAANFSSFSIDGYNHRKNLSKLPLINLELFIKVMLACVEISQQSKQQQDLASERAASSRNLREQQDIEYEMAKEQDRKRAAEKLLESKQNSNDENYCRSQSESDEQDRGKKQAFSHISQEEKLVSAVADGSAILLRSHSDLATHRCQMTISQQYYVSTIMVKLTNGTRISRYFKVTDTIDTVHSWVQACAFSNQHSSANGKDIRVPEKFSLVWSLSGATPLDRDKTLIELDLVPNGVLLIRDLGE